MGRGGGSGHSFSRQEELKGLAGHPGAATHREGRAWGAELRRDRQGDGTLCTHPAEETGQHLGTGREEALQDVRRAGQRWASGREWPILKAKGEASGDSSWGRGEVRGMWDVGSGTWARAGDEAAP